MEPVPTGSTFLKLEYLAVDIKLLHNEAIVLFDQWNLYQWTFSIGKRNRALGVCKYRSKTIEISEFHAVNDPAEKVLDTLKHEIAHALAGYKVASHGPEWKEWAIKVGCSPDACAARSKDDTMHKPRGKYYAHCKLCCMRFDWYKKPKRLDVSRHHIGCKKVDSRNTVAKLTPIVEVT